MLFLTLSYPDSFKFRTGTLFAIVNSRNESKLFQLFLEIQLSP